MKRQVVMNTNILKIIVIAALLITTVYSCENDEVCKSGDCYTMDIKGSVCVMPEGAGLRDVPVEVHHLRYSGQTLSKKVGSGRTDKNGEFEFKGKVDRNWKGEVFEVTIPSQNDYINVENRFLIKNDRYTFVYMSKLNFVFYNKAQLTINLNRTQNDEFDQFYFGYFFLNDGYAQWLIISSDPKPTSTFQIETAADIYTKILWQKMRQPNWEPISEKFDSLICRQDVNNVITINY